MNIPVKFSLFFILIAPFFSCTAQLMNSKQAKNITAKNIIGNPKYQAICYGGFREKTRDIEPTVIQIKEDLRILSAMNIKVLRTYNVHNKEVSNLLIAIRELKRENSSFEMYVMLGAWIDCKNAWTDMLPIHNLESECNAVEIAEAVRLSNEYPDIIKIIAVGNEAMVKWAASYYVEPAIILKWVTYLQNLKKEKKLASTLWITSSDNFASWGGGGDEYKFEDLKQLIKSVDYISMHTYPMHDTHYHPVFWGTLESENHLSDKEKIDAVMIRARDYAINQYTNVYDYMKSIGVKKPIAIGESGWATLCSELYGNGGSKATDEYKAAKFYALMREWSNKEGLSLFYFEAFDEQWKDSGNPQGSENHFGLINLKGEAKYAIWDLVEQGVFKNLTRDGKQIVKTYKGDEQALWNDVKMPRILNIN
jgi:exo-beta-1,3-glucanase (GH17 family)